MSTKGQSGQSFDKEIYFIILRPSEEKVDLDLEFSSSELAPSRIYKKIIKKGKDSFLEENVFKLIIKESQKEKEKEKEKGKRKEKEKEKEKNKKSYKI